MSRILVISYYAPPDPGVGGHRWAAQARYLRTLGHEVTVLTTSASGSLPEDGQHVLRTADVLGLLRRPAPVPGSPAGTPGLPVRLANDLVVPDAYLATWAPFALRAARRIVAERAIDCVITTGPPHSTHLVGLALAGRRRGPAWLADFRDGWTYDAQRPDWPTLAQRELDLRLERRVARAADVVVAATRPIGEDFERRLAVAAVHVPNAWDPALEDGVAAASATLAPSDPGTVNLVHTGTLSGAVGRAWGPRGRDLPPLFVALERVAKDRPDLRRRLRLVLVGGLNAADEKLIGHRLGPVVRRLGSLTRDQSVAVQRAGQALLLVTSQGYRSQATGKLYEYLAANRPIIGLAEDNEAARIIRETGTGVTVAPADVGGISHALNDLLDGRLAQSFSPRDLDRYRYPAPAEQVAALVDRVLSHR